MEGFVKYIQGIKPETWGLLMTVIQTFVILFGTVIAIVSLKIIQKTLELQAVTSFIEYLNNTSEDRKYVHQNFCDENFDFETLTNEDEEKLQNVVNFLNRIGLLLDNRLLSPYLVFSSCHTVIIRCYYNVKPYIRYQESKIGGRYGRRLDSLLKRATKYHDIRKRHRKTTIKIHHSKDQEPVEIYKTKIESGFSGLTQKLNWHFREFFKIF